MITLHDSPIPYFYMHLPDVQDLRVLISFTLFETQILANYNFTPSNILLNILGIIKVFEIIYR